MAKCWAPKLATDVIRQCLLHHRPLRLPSELQVGQRLRDVIGLQIGDGTAQIIKLVISRHCWARSSRPTRSPPP